MTRISKDGEEIKYVTNIEYPGPHQIQTTAPLSVNFTVQPGDNYRLHEDCACGDSATRSIDVNYSPTIAWYQPNYVESAEIHESAHGPYDGWIDSVNINGKTYAIKASVVEYHALTCPKCGGQIHMHNGWGSCPNCGTILMAIKEEEE